jgi:hypothetical protein
MFDNWRMHIDLVFVEMGKVVPGPGPKFFWLEPVPKFFLNRAGTKMFFLDRDRDQNIFDWDRHQNLFLKGPGPRSKTFSRRDRDRDLQLFPGGTGAGTKTDWSRSCLRLRHYVQWYIFSLMPIFRFFSVSFNFRKSVISTNSYRLVLIFLQ